MSAPRSLLAFSIGFFFSTALVLTTGCSASAPADPPPDAAVRPLEPAGHYELTSSFSLAAPPPAAATVLDELRAATDGPDDPSRFLIDLMIERLPEGRVRTYAAAVAPYVAAYVNERIDEVAPRFVPGARALGTGLSRIAHRFGTREELAIDASADTIGTIVDAQSGARRRSAWRTIVGLRFATRDGDLAAGHLGDEDDRGVVDVRFAPLGLPDTAAMTHVVLADDMVSFEHHRIPLPYTALLRLGFDFAVIPSVVPGAHDLAHALVALVDCDQLGAIVSDWVGLGSPAFYATGCTVGLTALAARIYAGIDMIDPSSLPLELAGTARAVDANGDARVDALASGTWHGSLAGSSVVGNFDGD